MAGVKRSRDESAYRAELSTAINSFAPVTRACFDCSTNGRVCRIGPRSSRYGECAARGYTMCDAQRVSVATSKGSFLLPFVLLTA